MTDELDDDIVTEFVSAGAKKLWLHDKGGKSDLQCPRIHLECSRLGCPQFSHHERHLGRIGQSTGPLSHAGHGYA